MNTLLTLAFVGTAYHGFQVQKNAPSVCAAVQDAMQAVLGARPDVKGCSRTDAGVHARGYCLNFWHEVTIPHRQLPLALNRALPEDIRVTSAREVPEGFHARYSALGKEYVYRLLNSRIDDPFTRGLYHRVGGALDEGAMQSAAGHLAGTHDFAAFMAAGGSVQNTVRTVTQLAVARHGRHLALTVAADGFLYNMVRIMAGTLLLVGQGKLAPDAVPGILAAGQRAQAGPTLPAQGLVLNRVFYSAEALGDA
jgi:tRNA pseudouridine38-40 synthase